MGKLWRRERDADGKSVLIDIDLDTLKIEAPTVVFLSGFLTTNSQPGFIAGAIKRMETLFRENPDITPPAQIFAWSHTDLKNLFNIARYIAKPKDRSTDAGRDIARGVIMPLVADGFRVDKQGDVHGTPVDVETACARLRNITLVAYSAGTVAAQETWNAAYGMMRDIGFKKHEARQMLSEIVLISTGNVSRPTHEVNRFTTLYLAASNDRIIKFKNRVVSPSLKTVFAWFSDKLTVRPLSENALLITANVNRTMHEWSVDENGNRMEREINKLYPKWALRSSYHELPHYMTTDETQSPFARVALYALGNAIGRTRTLSPFDLLAPPIGADPRFVTAYKKRVLDALDTRTFKQRWAARAKDLQKTLKK